MTHRRYEGRPASGDGPHYFFFVERPQILPASSAAACDDEIHGTSHSGEALVRPANRRRDGRCGALSLHPGVNNDEFDNRSALLENPQHVSESGAFPARHQRHAAGAAGNLLFAQRIEQALLLQAFMQLAKSDLQRAFSQGFHGKRRHLEASVFLIKRHPAADHHAHAHFRLEAQKPPAAREHHGAHLGCGVFQIEIGMPGWIGAPGGNFPLDQYLAEFIFQQFFYARVELRDGEHRRGRARRVVTQKVYAHPRTLISSIPSLLGT